MNNLDKYFDGEMLEYEGCYTDKEIEVDGKYMRLVGYLGDGKIYRDLDGRWWESKDGLKFEKTSYFGSKL